jgi:peptide/nickel transport system substrate-binding protein
MPDRARSLRSALAALAGAATLLLVCCRPGEQSHATKASSTTLRVGLGQVPSSATRGATALAQGLTQLAQNLTVEALARLADDGRPQPWLARDWQISDDHRALTVNLLRQAKFHDGTPLTAAIVADALKSSLPAFMGATFEDLESVSATNPQQVVIRLRRPSPFLLDTLETSIVRPGSQLIGTGPFIATNPQSPTELRANADYPLQKPAIDRITVASYPSVRAAWAEMLRGQLDMLYEVGPDALDSLQGASDIAIFTFTRRYQYLILLNAKTDAFRSKAIRQALNMAIDRDGIVRDALGGHGIASSGPVWPRNYGFRNGVGTPRYDTATASQTLSPQTPRKPATALHFTCLIRPDAVHERIALVVKRQLAEVGVDMNVEEVPLDGVESAMKNRRYEAMLTEMVSGPSLLRLYRMWHSGGVGGATSAPIDAALDRVRYAASDEEYTTGVTAFQQAVVDDPPAIFLAWMERARAVSKRFVVPAAEPGRDVLSTLRLWKPADAAQQANRN